MRFKGTIWMAAVLIGIVLYYYMVDVPAEKRQNEEKERSAKLLLFETGQVDEFRLIKKDQTLHLKRKGPEAWDLLEPVKAKADSGTVSSFLSLFQSARYSRIVEESAKDHAVYGLQEPSLSIRLTLKDQGGKTLLLGDDHPMSQSVYVKREGENQVLLATVNRKDLDKSPFDFRDKRLLAFNQDEIDGIQFLSEGKSFEVKRVNDQWEVKNGIKAKGDAGEINRFLGQVRNFTVKKFIDENPKNLTTYGLDAPAARLTLATGEKNPPLSLLVGSKLDEEGFYGKVEGTDNVVLFGLNLVETLSKKPVDFISKTLLEFKDEAISRIQLRTQGEEIILARDPQDTAEWNIVKPMESRADPATVNSLLFDLKSARVAEFVKTSIKKPELFGLDTPQRVMTLSLDKDQLWALEMGNPSADKKHFFAGRTGDSTVFTIAADTIDKLFRSLHDLKYKKLLRFNKEDVEKIVIEYSDKTFEMQKQNEDWNLTQPEKVRKVKGFIGNDILWSLNNLEYQSIVEPPLDDKATGLDHPYITVSIWKEKDQKIGWVAVGKQIQDKAEYYARVDGDPVLYAIKNKFLENLPKDLQKFKDP